MTIQLDIAATVACCAPLGGAPVEGLKLEALVAQFSAIAEPARLSIVARLAARRSHAATTRELAAELGLSEPTVSHHLKTLVEGGLLTKDRDGARVLYSLDLPSVRTLGQVLALCCDDEP